MLTEIKIKNIQVNALVSYRFVLQKYITDIYVFKRKILRGAINVVKLHPICDHHFHLNDKCFIYNFMLSLSIDQIRL